MAKQPKFRSWPHKVRPVRVAEMRVPPVGIAQRRFSRSQAEEYAATFDPNKFGIPAVNWRDAIYWLVDGQHRIEALKLWFAPSDPGQVDCNVYQDLTDAEMAELFIGLNTRRAVNAFDLFLIGCTAERTRESEIRRIVEANHCRISQEQDQHCIGAVSALCAIHERTDATVLGQTIRTARDGFDGAPLAFDSQLLRGLAHIYNRYNSKVDEKVLIAALSALKSVHRVFRKAEDLHERTHNQKSQCIAATIVEIYNRSVQPKHRLPSWWKSEAGSLRKAG